MEVNHWFSENFKEPESFIDFGRFSIWIDGDEVQIEYAEESITSRVIVDMITLYRFFEEHKKELDRRSSKSIEQPLQLEK